MVLGSAPPSGMHIFFTYFLGYFSQYRLDQRIFAIFLVSAQGIFQCSGKYTELDGRVDVLDPAFHGVVFALEVVRQRLPDEPIVRLQLCVREPERRDARAGPRHQEQSHESRRRVELQFYTT